MLAEQCLQGQVISETDRYARKIHDIPIRAKQVVAHIFIEKRSRHQSDIETRKVTQSSLLKKGLSDKAPQFTFSCLH